MKTQYIFLVIYTISLVSIASLINNLVRGPYMDEIFHIPQAQQYCKGEYDEWNPKLTTPPGLYITSNLIIKPLSFIFFNYINLCSTNFLRATNILFGIGLYKILRKLMINFHPFQDRNLISFNALTLSLFPVGWFFNFLYYTDSGSTFFVLWSYLLSIEKKYWMSALVGGISVLFRQSNIIWNCFILGTSLLAVLSDSNYDPKIKGMSYYRGINIRSDIVIKEITDFLLLALKYFPRLFTIFFPYFLIFLSFFSFLIWNGGIVLGDKSNHTAVLHIPQIFYFISFTTIFSAPIILKFDYVDRLITGLFTLKFNRKNFFFVILAMIMIFIINQFTYEHKFLLSDNRHYTFYIWKNIYRRHYLVKYFLVPAYITAGWILLESIALQQSFLWILIYIAAVCLSLIPSPLLEFRYFIIPYYIFRINIGQPKNYTRLILEFLFYAIVNAQTVYIFLYEPFLWFSEINKWQRFMW